jgi:hypothetical protein
LPPAQKRFASFGFDHGAEVAAAMAHVQRGPGGKTLAFDRARAQSATSGMELGEAVRTIAAVAGKAGSWTQAMKDVMGLRRAKADLEEAPWSLHLTADGATAAVVEAQLEAMRAVCVAAGGVEIPPAVPQALDARPFSVRGMVGQQGERWVPVHGHLPLSQAAACVKAVETLFEERSAEISRFGVRVNWLMTSAGAYITIEPMFYWRDALDPLHLKHLSERNRSRFGGFAANLDARGFVRELRVAVRDVMDRFGAAHGQIGRFYVPPRGDMLDRVKAMLDPQHRMNPGVLGL